MIIARSTNEFSGKITTWIVRQLTDAERNQHIDTYGETEIFGYDSCWCLERTVHFELASDGSGPKTAEPTVMGWGETALHAALQSIEHAYINAVAIDDLHVKAKSVLESRLDLRDKIFKNEMALAGLKQKYESLFQSKLKEARLHKAAHAGREQGKVKKIREDVIEVYMGELAHLRKEAESLRDRLADNLQTK